MKILKFRAWELDEKRWLNKDELFFSILKNEIHGWQKEGNWEISQWIGLKDKNGKEVYEGDIVKKMAGSFTVDLNSGFKSGDKTGIFQINFNQLHCCFGLFSGLGYVDGLLASEYNSLGKRNSDWRSDDIEVIGNIYENPELLKDEHKTN